ncbi:MAG: putative sulfate exporter family transporter [Marinobacter sp.]|uniref:YeiH family protein n=1 Tax=Marinobacter sp. TaxID=50741 RepID=UPI003297A6EF
MHIASRQKFPPMSFCLAMVLLIVLALLAVAVAALPGLPTWNPGALTWAILFGLIIGNLLGTRLDSWSEPTRQSVQQALAVGKSQALRSGIVLMGFQITVQDFVLVGWNGLLTAAFMLITTMCLVFWLGLRVLKMSRDQVLLIGAGSSICGAAAVMATSQVSGASARDTSVAVATVVLFGTLAMFIYPLLHGLFAMNDAIYGVFVGATIHEVAQVVVAGEMISTDAANSAMITKMLRVLMLVPFMLWVALAFRPKAPGPVSGHSVLRGRVPWFAILFLLAILVHSSGVLPAVLVTVMATTGTLLLTLAMVSIGFTTRWSGVKAAGQRPLILAFVLALYLIIGGYIATWVFAQLTS